MLMLPQPPKLNSVSASPETNSETSAIMIKTIGIIGAGIAGLSTVKIFKAFGYEVTAFEKEPDVGGVWSASRRYPGLTTQNPRDTYALSDYPMPRSYPEWPSGQQCQEYLQAYTEKFDLAQNISLNSEVTKAVIDPVTKRWTLTVRRVTEKYGAVSEEHQFDYLIVCNGIFSIPFIPEYDGAEEFIAAGGQICHTSEFIDAETARNKNVLVVGYGKSSCDVAMATVSTSKSTIVITRSLLWKVPKKIKDVLNFKYLLLTRLGEGLFRYIRLRGFEKFLHGPGLPLRNFVLDSVESVIAKQYQLEELDLLLDKPFETIARSTVSMVTDGFYESVKDGRLTVKKDTVITRLRPGKAELSNGEVLPADIVICGTGWQQVVPFFDDDVRSKVTDARGNFRLYRAVLPVDIPTLAFNGYNSSFYSQLCTEIGALWLIEFLRGGITLPSADQMNAYIDVRLEWMEERTDGKHAKGTNIIPFSVHHMDELLNDIDLNLNALVRFKQWLVPVTGRDYRKITGRLMKRYGISESRS